jgi:hypothetical protein
VGINADVPHVVTAGNHYGIAVSNLNETRAVGDK